MLKRKLKNKIYMSLIAIIICTIIYLFPNKEMESPIEYNYNSCATKTVYLVDNNDYVARTEIVVKSTELKEQINEIISALIINSNKKEYLPSGFKAIIPESTKILSLDFDEKLIKVNFSEEFLNMTIENEEQIIEALIFSLLEIEDFNQLMIFVEGKLLEQLPISHKRLPIPLTKEYGINKIYNINDYKDTTKVTTYYLGKYNNLNYYIPVTIVTNDKSDKTEIIINNLVSSQTYTSNIMSYLSSKTNLINYEIEDGIATMNFNIYLLSGLNDKTISEEVKYSIYYSLRDTLDVKTVIFNVDNEMIEKFSIAN